VSNCLDWRPAFAEGPDGRLYPSLFQHPPAPDQGVGEATWRLAMPAAAPGARLMLSFGTVVTGPTDDGVKMTVLVDGREVWSDIQANQGQPRWAEVDLSAYAGARVALTLRVDARANNTGDWSNWLRPVMVVRRAGE
jgi:hypothetical protein